MGCRVLRLMGGEVGPLGAHYKVGCRVLILKGGEIGPLGEVGPLGAH